MTSRSILLVMLAGAVLVCAGMLGGCKKQEPVRTVPAAPAGPNSVTKDVQKATSDLAAKTEAAAAAEQTMCPVMEAPIDKNIFVEYKGKKVYFCCASCKGDFEKDPEKYIAKLPQFK